jgi:hypothetical protein
VTTSLPPEALATLRAALSLANNNPKLTAAIESLAIQLNRHALSAGYNLAYEDGLKEGRVRGRRKAKGLPEMAKRRGRPMAIDRLLSAIPKMKGDLEPAAKYCVYTHSWDGKVFYVGRRGKPRPDSFWARSPAWRKHVASCDNYEINICARTDDKNEAAKIEREMIIAHNPKCNIRMRDK